MIIVQYTLYGIVTIISNYVYTYTTLVCTILTAHSCPRNSHSQFLLIATNSLTIMYPVETATFLNILPYFSAAFIDRQINTLWSQFTRAKRLASSGSPGITLKQMGTYRKQIRMLSFLEPFQRKRTSTTNLVSIDK